MSSVCFEHYVFIIRRTVLYMRFYMLCFSYVYLSSLAGGRMCSIYGYIDISSKLHKRRIVYPCQESKGDSFITQPSHYTGCVVSVHNVFLKKCVPVSETLLSKSDVHKSSGMWRCVVVRDFPTFRRIVMATICRVTKSFIFHRNDFYG
jgi:hypothetical protein